MWPAPKLQSSTRTSTPLRGGADYLRSTASRSSIPSKTVITDDASGSVYVFCDLSVDNPTDHDTSATTVGTASARQTVALELTHTFASAGTITLSCEPTNPANTTNVGTELTKIMAIKVGDETHQIP